MTTNFENMMNQYQQNAEQMQYAFVADPMNPFKVKIANFRAILGRDMNPLEIRMINRMMQVDEYLWSRNQLGGIVTGFSLFDEAIDHDVSPGLYLIAAAPNVGKSAWLLQLGRQIANLNENVHVAYHSLDDSLNEIVPRYIAGQEQITISQAKNPGRNQDKPDILEKRNNGMKHLYMNAHKFSFWDANEGNSVEELEQRIIDFKMHYPEGTRLILMLDSIYDLTVTSKQLSEKATFEHIATTVKSWATSYDVAIFGTAHLKKNGGRRPAMEDLKENNRLEYEANFVGLLYNEVGVKEEEASVYWLHEEDDRKMPVIEFRVGKNKFGSYKGTMFYEFIPDFSHSLEVPKEHASRYVALMSGN